MDKVNKDGVYPGVTCVSDVKVEGVQYLGGHALIVCGPHPLRSGHLEASGLKSAVASSTPPGKAIALCKHSSSSCQTALPNCSESPSTPTWQPSPSPSGFLSRWHLTATLLSWCREPCLSASTVSQDRGCRWALPCKGVWALRLAMC